MWAERTKETADGTVSLGVVLLEDGVLTLDVPAAQSRGEIEPLFERGDITYAWVGYGDAELEPAKYLRLSDRWFVAVLNSLPKPYGWRLIDAGAPQG